MLLDQLYVRPAWLPECVLFAFVLFDDSYVGVGCPGCHDAELFYFCSVSIDALHGVIVKCPSDMYV